MSAAKSTNTDAIIDDDDTTHSSELIHNSIAPVSSKPPITTPSPPRWRFVAEARKKTGYSSADAGQKVDGLSAEELAKHYIPPTIETDQRQGKSITVSKLVIPEFGVSSDATFSASISARLFNNEQQQSFEDLRRQAEQIRIDRDRLEEEIRLAQQQKEELEEDARRAREEREREDKEAARLSKEKELEDETALSDEVDMGVVVAVQDPEASVEPEVSSDYIKDADETRRYKECALLALILLLLCVCVATGVAMRNQSDKASSTQGLRGSNDTVSSTSEDTVLSALPTPSWSPTSAVPTPDVTSLTSFPTASLISHSTSSPSTNSSLSNATCRPGEAYFSVNFTFDAHPLDGIYWYVLEKCTNNMHFECKQCFEGLAPLSTEFRSGCLPDDMQFVFYFDDYSGEFWSQGGYSIFYDEETIFNSTGDVKLTQQVSFGGGGTMCSSIRYDGAVFNSIGD